MTHIVVEREIGGRLLKFETGKIAKLASGAVMASYGDSTVLCTAMRADARPGLDFFPLQVDYREKLSAAGKFPGGFRKREGAPNEKEILTMRMIDRPIRPLFPDGFIDEIQIQCWVMSHDGENDTDVLSGTAASAALMISNAPFEGPTATVRVGRIHHRRRRALRAQPYPRPARLLGPRSRPPDTKTGEHDRSRGGGDQEQDMLDCDRLRPGGDQRDPRIDRRTHGKGRA
jgi:polyribonucleotide nucleotidyltransferase